MFHRGLHPVDWALIALYCVGMMLVGYYYSRRRSDTSSYFLGGGNMRPSLVGISLFATLFSTISYLSMPGEMIKNGPSYLLVFVAIPLSYLVVGTFLIPAFMRQRVVSAYELLEARLGMRIRLLGASLFIFLRLVWMTVLLYMASSAIAVIVGLQPHQTAWIIFITGGISVFYASMGGMRAVVITDVAQSAILLLGAIATLAVVTWRLQSLRWLPTEWDPSWERLPVFSLDPHIRLTAIGAVAMNFFWQVATAGGDQLAIQRYMSTRDTAAAKRAFLVNSIVGVVVSLVVCAIGFAVKEYYRTFATLLPGGETPASFADYLFPTFISNELPIGLAGLVVAAMVAAAMSSLDSGVNSITAVLSRDLLPHVGRRPDANPAGSAVQARTIAILLGMVVILLATQVGHVPGNFLDITKKTTNLFAAPIFGLFFLTLFVPRVNAFGAGVGTLYGFTAAVLIAYWDVLTGLRPLSFMWIMPTAFVCQIAVAYTLALAGCGRRESVRLPAAVALVPIVLLGFALIFLRS